MKQKNFAIFSLASILILSLAACYQKTSLIVEEHAIKSMDWDGEPLHLNLLMEREKTSWQSIRRNGPDLLKHSHVQLR